MVQLSRLSACLSRDYFIYVMLVVCGVDELVVFGYLRVRASAKQLPCQMNCLYGLAVLPCICDRDVQTYYDARTYADVYVSDRKSVV